MKTNNKFMAILLVSVLCISVLALAACSNTKDGGGKIIRSGNGADNH